MTPDQMKIAIETRFTTLWESATPISYQGVPYKVTQGQAYASVWFDLIRTDKPVIGQNNQQFRRHLAGIQIDINVPNSVIGTSTDLGYVEKILDIFDNKQFNGITTWLPIHAKLMPEGFRRSCVTFSAKAYDFS